MIRKEFCFLCWAPPVRTAWVVEEIFRVLEQRWNSYTRTCMPLTQAHAAYPNKAVHMGLKVRIPLATA